MADDVVRITVGVSVSYVAGSKREEVVEIDRAEWAAMNAEQRQEFMDEAARDYAMNYVEWWGFAEDEG